MPTYDIDFDFTTVNSKSMFTGRSGTLNVDTTQSIDLEKERKGLEQLCANFILSKNPKWNIFMVHIKKVTELTTKQ